MFPSLTRDDVYRIETPRLWLRWPRFDDACVMAAWSGRPEVATMTSTWKVGATGADIAERIATLREANERGASIGLVLTAKGCDAEAIGMIAVGVNRNGKLELGYQLNPDYWARGFMTEAARALVAQAFELASVTKIVASTRPDNHASIKVLGRVGFLTTGGGEHDSPLYGKYMVRHFVLPRQRPSALAEARRRLGPGETVLAHDLVGLV